MPAVLSILISAASIASTASASVLNNVNYRSFSNHPRHAHLAVDVAHLIKRADLSSAATEPPFITAGAFSSGIASGDPATDSVVLWTRLAPCGDAQTTSSDDEDAITVAGAQKYAWPIYTEDGRVNHNSSNKMGCVTYKIWKKTGGSEAAASFSDKIYTSKEVDWTVKAIATGLESFTQYNYRFYMCGKETTVQTTIGVAKTLPTVATVPQDGLKFNVYTCANWPWGFFNAYSIPTKKSRQPDYIIHLGDYIYESPKNFYVGSYSSSLNRLHDNTYGLMSLKDFRNRYRLYRTDSNLQTSHAAYSWISVWDDHETGDNAWNDGMTNWNKASLYPNTKPSYAKVKENSVRAYFEWLPIRQQNYQNNLRIWRKFSMGGLVDLFMVDTRLYDRDLTMYTGGTNRAVVTSVMYDPDPAQATPGQRSRTMMGADQESWFTQQFSSSTAKWQLIGNQVIFSYFGTDYDKWQGYPATRANIMKSIKDTSKNAVFLSGDSHEAWAFDVREVDAKNNLVGTYDPATGDGSIAVEFGVTGISSPGPSETIEFKDIPSMNSKDQAVTKSGANGLLWRESWYRGYMEVDVTTSLLTTRMVGTPCMKNLNNVERVLAEFQVEHGTHKLKRHGGTPNVVAVDNGVANGGLYNGGIINSTLYDIKDMSKNPPITFDKDLTLDQICGANGVFVAAPASAGCSA